MRRMKVPPAFFAASQFSTAVRRLPTWSSPVGDGAKRVIMFVDIEDAHRLDRMRCRRAYVAIGRPRQFQPGSVPEMPQHSGGTNQRSTPPEKHDGMRRIGDLWHASQKRWLL